MTTEQIAKDAAGAGGFIPSAAVPGPTKPAGSDGANVIGGFVVSGERNPKLAGQQRWVRYDELTLNIAIVASAINMWTTLAGAVKWTAAPNKRGGKDAERAVDLINEGLFEAQMSQPWRAVVRRQLMKKFRGFALHEMLIRRRGDGMIVCGDLQDRPQWSIWRWNKPDEQSAWEGVEQITRTGSTYYVPRERLLYSVENTLTTSPEGSGLLRQLAEPARILELYQRWEGIGFQTDLSGVPVGRAPLSKLAQTLDPSGTMSGQELQSRVGSTTQFLTDFLNGHNKTENQGIMLDSATYPSISGASNSPSSIYEWAFELLTGASTSQGAINNAIGRLMRDIARVMSAEFLLLGDMGSGSDAMHEDKTAMFGLVCNGALDDIADDTRRDVAARLVALNGLDPETCTPILQHEPVARGSVTEACQALQLMFQAQIDKKDPACDILRARLDLPPAPEVDEASMGLPQLPPGNTPGDEHAATAAEAKPGEDADAPAVGATADGTVPVADGKPGNVNARTSVTKGGFSEEDHPRDERGRFSDGGGSGPGGAKTMAEHADAAIDHADRANRAQRKFQASLHAAQDSIDDVDHEASDRHLNDARSHLTNIKAHVAAANEHAERTRSNAMISQIDRDTAGLADDARSSLRSVEASLRFAQEDGGGERLPPEAGALKANEYRRMAESYPAKLTSEQRDAVIDYSGNSYKAINSALRAGAGSPGAQSQNVAKLDAAIGKHVLDQDTKVYRVMRYEPGRLGGMQVGSTFQDHAYVSTTVDRNFLDQFYSGRPEERVDVHVTLPKGSSAAPISNVSAHKHEREMLLPRGKSYRITKVVEPRNGAPRQIHMEMLSESRFGKSVPDYAVGRGDGSHLAADSDKFTWVPGNLVEVDSRIKMEKSDHEVDEPDDEDGDDDFDVESALAEIDVDGDDGDGDDVEKYSSDQSRDERGRFGSGGGGGAKAQAAVARAASRVDQAKNKIVAAKALHATAKINAKATAKTAKAAAKLAAKEPSAKHTRASATAQRKAQRAQAGVVKARAAVDKHTQAHASAKAKHADAKAEMAASRAKPVRTDAATAAAKPMTEKHYQQRFDALGAVITPDEHEAAIGYSMNGYKLINGSLRTGERIENARLQKVIEERVPHLDSMLSKAALDKPIITHRWSAAHPDFMGLKVGDAFTDKAYVSTSIDPERGRFTNGVQFHVTNPRGTKIAAIPSDHPDEKEMLLARGSAMRVDKREQHVDKDGNLTHVFHVTVIGQP